MSGLVYLHQDMYDRASNVFFAANHRRPANDVRQALLSKEALSLS